MRLRAVDFLDFPLPQIIAEKDADFNGLGLGVCALSQGQRPRTGDGRPDFAIRVLIEHHIDGFSFGQHGHRFRCEFHRHAAEVRAVGVARVGTDGDAVEIAGAPA